MHCWWKTVPVLVLFVSESVDGSTMPLPGSGIKGPSLMRPCDIQSKRPMLSLQRPCDIQSDDSVVDQLEQLLDEEQMAELNFNARAKSPGALIEAYVVYGRFAAVWEQIKRSLDDSKSFSGDIGSCMILSVSPNQSTRGSKASRITCKDAEKLESKFVELFEQAEKVSDELNRIQAITRMTIFLQYIDSTYTPRVVGTVLKSLMETLDISIIRPIESVPEDVIEAANDLNEIRDRIRTLRSWISYCTD